MLGDPDLGNEEKDAPVPDQHDPHLGAAQSTSGEESMGLPYSWAPSQQPGWGARAAGQRESTWLTQPMDQEIYLEWDPAEQSEWSRVQVQAGARAPERGVVAWWRERNKMRQEIHFLRRNVELLLARAEAAERDRQDPLQLLPPPLEREQPVPVPSQQPLLLQFEDPFEEEKAHARVPPASWGDPGLAGAGEDSLLPRGASPRGEVGHGDYGADRPGGVVHAGGRGRGLSVQSAATETAGQSPTGFSPSPVGGTSPARGGKESLYAQQRRLGLCLNCAGEGHKATVCPSKKPDPPIVPASGAAAARMARGPKSLFKKGLGLQVEQREANSASEETGGPESSKELAGNDSDLA
uniref:Uncharacterized protein n=1 Tax=Sphaerodactylus townsendi TaxID=933632 RepID=A0ACB8E670_9SAUR